MPWQLASWHERNGRCKSRYKTINWGLYNVKPKALAPLMIWLAKETQWYATAQWQARTSVDLL